MLEGERLGPWREGSAGDYVRRTGAACMTDGGVWQNSTGSVTTLVGDERAAIFAEWHPQAIASAVDTDSAVVAGLSDQSRGTNY